MANANIKVNVNKQEIDEWADYEEVKNNVINAIVDYLKIFE